jgi:hypothetical protein
MSSADQLPLAAVPTSRTAADRLPFAVTPAWRAAADRSGGRCECRDLDCKHGNTWPCPTWLRDGHRLFLAEDGRIRCRKCHDRAVRLAQVIVAEPAATVEYEPPF